MKHICINCEREYTCRKESCDHVYAFCSSKCLKESEINFEKKFDKALANESHVENIG